MIFDDKKGNIDTSDFSAKRTYVKKSLSEIIYDDLKRRILYSEISGEERLVDKGLADYYQTSRTPIRDALGRLENENIIRKLDYGGYVVTELNQEEIEELYGIRAVLEGYAASLATQKITKKELKEMTEIIEKSHKALEANNIEEVVELNTIFHGCIYNASKNKYLLKLLDRLWEHIYRYRKIIFRTEKNVRDAIQDHEVMIKKMSEGDYLSVERLVKEHVLGAVEAFKDAYKKEA